ncbi:pyridoxamine 5'-phosphate oxidase family protein [Fulvivirgaceae bacterium PWU4]|uniref:Pyridoxamine 5'-phosphate oxidase family protein n=1 Tax=Chryseosolibacter histidini TaxID=2782349 RepID=A0AAP2DRW5_9BACT|nr:pyridoxamine 5'-phosphate oxidase family protein [Chryseosolibacter histidini]MBT1699269.1 pyridoxamine 5'-phosphate oxidase family protein [Chryseosolibacter histidini]
MLGKLTEAQIDQVLYTQFVGRIGCRSNNKMYVVPVTYVYHEGYIYAHSREGLKIKMMRQNPDVCFQVDSIENMTNWRSIIVWGKYEELKDRKQQAALKIIMDRLAPFIMSETVRPSHEFAHAPEVVEKSLKAVVYRIKAAEKTGRFEKM